jgi:hypothetical protein
VKRSDHNPEGNPAHDDDQLKSDDENVSCPHSPRIAISPARSNSDVSAFLVRGSPVNSPAGTHLLAPARRVGEPAAIAHNAIDMRRFAAIVSNPPH